MAIVYIGSARIDENGNTHGGKAGDQKNGAEVSTQKWYKHSKGWRVFRATNPDHAAKIAEVMKWACEDDRIGYDQYQRNTLYNELAKHDFTSYTLTKNVETDCSALVRVCLKFCAIDVPADFRTGNMPSYLLKTGAFVELKGSKYTDQSAYLGAGDILVTKTSGHTVVVISNGDKYEGVVEEKTYALGDRLLKTGCEGEDVKTLQEYLLQLGYDVGSYGADGDFGSATERAVKAFQTDQGLDSDGQYGEKTHAALMTALDAKAETPSVPSEPTNDLTVADGAWCVRTGPGTAYPVAGYVHGGDKVSKIDPGNWQPIEFGGEVRYISKKAIAQEGGTEND